MPRATVTPIQAQGSAAVEFFRKAPFELADFVMGLCRTALKERKDKSLAAKEVAAAHGLTKTAKAKGPKPKPAAAAKVKTAAKRKAAKGPKKSHHKKPAAAAVPANSTGASTGASAAPRAPYPVPGSDADTVGPVVPEPELAGSAV